MSYAIPDPRYEELLPPGVKPVGNVVIDWSHPLAKHITHIFMPIPDFRADLIHGVLPVTGSAVITGKSVDFTSGGDYFSYSRLFGNPSEGTIISRIKRTNSANVGGIFSDQDVANWGAGRGISFLNNTTGSSALQFIIGSVAARTIDTSVSVGNWYDVAGSYKLTTPTKLYINGSEPAYQKQSTPASFTASTFAPRIGTYYDGSGLRSLYGSMEYIIVFDKQLTKEQINDAQRDQKQFVIPA